MSAPLPKPGDSQKQQQLATEQASGSSRVMEAARQAAMKPGRALAERLKHVRKGVCTDVTLEEVRGFSGCMREGFLADAAESIACCFSWGKKGKGFYVMKGPWLLCFQNDSPDAKLVGVPVPLDGAVVCAHREFEFEIRNVHIKSDFCGKEALKQIKGNKKETFEHVISKQLEAPTTECRDQWVQVLQAQIDMLTEALARRLLHQKSSYKSEASTGTVAAINNVASLLFLEYEEQKESSEIGLVVASSGLAATGF